MSKPIFEDLMKAGILPVLERSPEHYAARLTEQLGAVAALMMGSVRHRHLAVETLLTWVYPALKVGQIKTYYAPEGHPLGYVMWAWMSAEAERRWIDQPDHSHYPSDWTNGDRLWLVDLAILPGFEKLVSGHVKSTLFPDQKAVKVRRNGTDVQAPKISAWFRTDRTWRFRTKIEI